MSGADQRNRSRASSSIPTSLGDAGVSMGMGTDNNAPATTSGANTSTSGRAADGTRRRRSSVKRVASQPHASSSSSSSPSSSREQTGRRGEVPLSIDRPRTPPLRHERYRERQEEPSQNTFGPASSFRMEMEHPELAIVPSPSSSSSTHADAGGESPRWRQAVRKQQQQHHQEQQEREQEESRDAQAHRISPQPSPKKKRPQVPEKYRMSQGPPPPTFSPSVQSQSQAGDDGLSYGTLSSRQKAQPSAEPSHARSQSYNYSNYSRPRMSGAPPISGTASSSSSAAIASSASSPSPQTAGFPAQSSSSNVPRYSSGSGLESARSRSGSGSASGFRSGASSNSASTGVLSGGTSRISSTGNSSWATRTPATEYEFQEASSSPSASASAAPSSSVSQARAHRRSSSGMASSGVAASSSPIQERKDLVSATTPARETAAAASSSTPPKKRQIDVPATTLSTDAKGKTKARAVNESWDEDFFFDEEEDAASAAGSLSPEATRQRRGTGISIGMQDRNGGNKGVARARIGSSDEEDDWDMQLGDTEEPPRLGGPPLGIPNSRSTRTLRAGADNLSTKLADTEMERALSGASVESGFTDPDEKTARNAGDGEGSALAGTQFPPHRRSNTAEEEPTSLLETPPRRHGASLPRSATRKSESKPLPIFPAALQRSPPLGLEEENSGQTSSWGGQQRGRRDSDAAGSESLSSSAKKKAKRQSWNPFKSSIKRDPSPAQDSQHQHSASLSASPNEKVSIELTPTMMIASQVPVTRGARVADLVEADAKTENKKHKRAQSSLSLAFGFHRPFSRTTSGRSKLQNNPSASSSTLSLASVDERSGVISASPPTLQLEIPRETPLRSGSGGSDPVEELVSAHSAGSSRQSEAQRVQKTSPSHEMPPPPPPVFRQRVASPGHESRPSDGSSNLTQSSHEMSSRSNSRSNSSSAYTQASSSILSAEDRAASRRFFAMSRKGSESTQSSEASMAGTSLESHGRKTSVDLSGTSRRSPISSTFALDHQRRSSAQGAKDHKLVNSESIATISVQMQQTKPTPPPKSPLRSGKERAGRAKDEKVESREGAEGQRPSMGTKSQSETFVRRNSLGDLRIPSRISQAQQGLRTNIGLVRDFAQGIGELKSLQGRHRTLTSALIDAPAEVVAKIDEGEVGNSTWWECADVLVCLAEGKSVEDDRVTAMNVSYSESIGHAREKRIASDTPSVRRSDHSASGNVSEADSTGYSDRGSIYRSGSRVVSAERELDILTAMLSGEKPETSQLHQAASRLSVDQGPIRPQSSCAQPSPARLSFAEPMASPSSELGHSTSSMPRASLSNDVYGKAGAAVSTDSLQPGSMGRGSRGRLKSASRGGLLGLRELLKSFRINSSSPDVPAGFDALRAGRTSIDSVADSGDQQDWSKSASSVSMVATNSIDRKRKESKPSRRLSQILGMPKDSVPASDQPDSLAQGPSSRRASGEEAFANARRRLFSFGSSQGGHQESPSRPTSPLIKEGPPATPQSPRPRILPRPDNSSKERPKHPRRSISIAGPNPSPPALFGTSPPTALTPPPPSSFRPPLTQGEQDLSVYKKLAMRPEAMPSLIAYLQVTKAKCLAHLEELEQLQRLRVVASKGPLPKMSTHAATIRSPKLGTAELPGDPSATVRLNKAQVRHSTPFPSMSAAS